MLNPPREAIRSGARSFERALFLGAFLALGYVSWMKLDRLAYQRIESARFAAAASASAAASTSSTSSKGSKDGTALRNERQTAPDVIGRLTIPAASIDAMVAEGVDDPTLNRAVGHIPSTPLPGEPGNVALAGHRDTFFRGLAKLELGDPIQLITTAGTYDYVVEDLRIVEPTETQVLAPESASTLTLITCYPFRFIGTAPQRFVVRAREIGRPAGLRLAPNVDIDRL
jgi:sortase A